MRLRLQRRRELGKIFLDGLISDVAHLRRRGGALVTNDLGMRVNSLQKTGDTRSTDWRDPSPQQSDSPVIPGAAARLYKLRLGSPRLLGRMVPYSLIRVFYQNSALLDASLAKD